MGSFTKALAIVLHTVNAVSDAETQLAGQPGATKKQQVLTPVVAGITTLTGELAGPAATTALQGAVGSIIDGYVAIANLIGLFRHAKPVQTPATPPLA